jgi:hypothetical protein
MVRLPHGRDNKAYISLVPILISPEMITAQLRKGNQQFLS